MQFVALLEGNALLLSIEKLFGLTPLGYASAPGLLPFDNSVYNAYK